MRKILTGRLRSIALVKTPPNPPPNKIAKVPPSTSAHDDVRSRAGSLDYEAWFRRQVEAGLQDAAAGRLVPDEAVKAEFAARRAANRRRTTG
jgi:predicted transcriptional regulator